MKLACNYYPETEELVREGKIDIDYFKFPGLGYQMTILDSGDLSEFSEFISGISQVKPVLLHGLYPAPHNLSSEEFINEISKSDTADRLLEITKTPGISLHLSLTPIEPSADENRLARTIIRNIRYLKERYPHLDFISVENPDSPKFGALINPGFISNIVKEADCRFLLDISHAFCAALRTGANFREYLMKLPLEKTYEVHLNGWIQKDGDVMCHVKINGAGYEALRDILGYCSPKIVTIEYGRDNDRLNTGVPLISPNMVNGRAKKEIAEQAAKVREIIFR